MSTATPIRRARPRMRIPVFNPTHYSDQVSVGGTFFAFDPMSVGRCICAHHQKAVGEDPTGVHELYEWPRNEKGHVITEGGLGTRSVVMTADEVADFIVSQECRGAKGYIRLEGTAEEQVEQKRSAVEKWVTYHLAEVEQEISGWEMHVASLKGVRPGDPPPRRPRRIVAAYQFRDNHLAMLGRAAKFVCDMCGWDGLEAVPPMPDTAESLTKHMQVTHPGVVVGRAPVVEAPRVPTPAAPETDEERRTRLALEDQGDNPSTAVEGAGAAPVGDAAVATETDSKGKALIVRAKFAGVKLSVADMKGLSHDDPDVIKDVVERIDAGKTAQKARRDAEAAERREKDKQAAGTTS